MVPLGQRGVLLCITNVRRTIEWTRNSGKMTRFIAISGLVLLGVLSPTIVNGQSRAYYMPTAGFGIPPNHTPEHCVLIFDVFPPDCPSPSVFEDAYTGTSAQFSILRPDKQVLGFLEPTHVISLFPYTGYAFGLSSTSRWHHLGVALGVGGVPVHEAIFATLQSRVIVFPVKWVGLGMSQYKTMRLPLEVNSGFSLDLVVRLGKP